MNRRGFLAGLVTLAGCKDETTMFHGAVPTGFMRGGLFFTHLSQFTINAAGIGPNSSTSWKVRDVGAATVGTLDAQWNGGSNPTGSNPGGIYNLQNQVATTFNPTGAATPPGRPHPYITNFMAGCHYDTGGHPNSDIVMPVYTFTPPTPPYVIYMSAWMREDPNWPFAGNYSFFNFSGTSTNGSTTISGISTADIAKMQLSGGGTDGGPGFGGSFNAITSIGTNSIVVTTAANSAAGSGTFSYINSNNDNNNKHTEWGVGPNPYTNTNYMYTSYSTYNSPNGVPPSTMQWVWDGDNSVFPNPDNNGHNGFWGLSSNEIWNGWLKLEKEIFVTTLDGLANGGSIKLWEGNVLKVNFAGRTDGGSGWNSVSSARNVAFGGYYRGYPNTNAFRYFADMRIGFGPGNLAVGSRFPRLMAGNASTYASSTITEPQDVVSWNDPTITFNFWKGALVTGSTVYFHVITQGGTTMDNVANGFVN